MKLIFLGSGPTKPVMGKEKDRRRNSSLLLITRNNITVLFDCTPNFYEQMQTFAEKIDHIDYILLSHGHYDAVGGIPQLKHWLKEKNQKIKPVVYMQKKTEDRVKEDFKDLSHLEIKYFHPYKILNLSNLKIVPFKVIHAEAFPTGHKFPCVGFRIDNKIVYSEDIEKATEKSLPYFNKSHLVIIDAAMWFGKQIRGHMNVKTALDFLKNFKIRQIILTQAGHTYPSYEQSLREIRKYWKKNKGSSRAEIILAYDGLIIDIPDYFQKVADYLIELREGIYLTKPHARWIWEEKKKLIVKAKKYTKMIGKLLYVVDDEYAYGIIKLKRPLLINLKQFAELKPLHLVSNEERINWWGNKRYLFMHGFDLIEKFKEPRKIKIKKGTQTFVKDVKFLEEFSVVELIEDITEYDPSTPNNKQLADDWRIVCAWYATKKKGGEIKFSLETIVNLAKLIYDEIQKRVKRGDMKHEFNPEKMTTYSKKLYKIVSEEKVTEASESTEEKKSENEYTVKIKEIEDLLKEFKEFKIIKDFISIVGSTIKGPPKHEPGDIDLHIRLREPSDYIKRAIEVRLLKMLPEKTASKIHFVWGDPEGSHDTFVPLYDLAVIRREPQIVEMADTTTAQFPELLPKVWIVGKRIRAKKKTGKIKEITEKPKMYVIDFDDGTSETVNEGELELEDFVPLKSLIALKSTAIDNKSLFYDLDKTLEILNPNEKNTYFVEEKFDGFRGILHKSGNQIKIFSDQAKDITDAFPTIIKQSKGLTPENIIIDGEIVPYNEKGESLGRRGLMEFIGAIKSGKKLDDSRIKFHVFDILYYKNQSLHDARLYERKKVLNLLNFTENIKKIPYVVVKDKSQLEKAIKLFRALPKSEGAMIKSYNSIYPASGKTSEWIKFRKVRDVHVRVLNVLPVKGTTNAWRYESGIEIPENKKQEFYSKKLISFDNKTYMSFGNTFNTSVKAKIGDMIDVAVQEIWKHTHPKKGIHYSWHKPNVRFRSEREKTSTLVDLDAIVAALGVLVKEYEELSLEEFEKVKKEFQGIKEETRAEYATKFWLNHWWKSFPKNGEGNFIYHHHWRGLNEEESKQDESKLLEINRSVHGDIRMQFNFNTLFGFTVFLGKVEDLKKGRDLWALKEPDKLQGDWKLWQPRAWVDVAKKKAYISKPTGVGATAKKYAKFFASDWGTYQIGVWREHSFELFFKGKKLKGRYLIVYAPVGIGGRKWLIGKPEDQTPYAEKHGRETIIKELKTKKQKWLIWAKPGEKPVLIDIEKID